MCPVHRPLLGRWQGTLLFHAPLPSAVAAFLHAQERYRHSLGTDPLRPAFPHGPYRRVYEMPSLFCVLPGTFCVCCGDVTQQEEAVRMSHDAGGLFLPPLSTDKKYNDVCPVCRSQTVPGRTFGTLSFRPDVFPRFWPRRVWLRFRSLRDMRADAMGCLTCGWVGTVAGSWAEVYTYPGDWQSRI